MDNALLVDELDPINDLQHVLDDFSLGQLEILVDDSLKQLAARDPAAGTMTSSAMRHKAETSMFLMCWNGMCTFH